MVGRGKDAGPGIGWNNPDILEVGVIRKGMTPLTVVEAQSHFALWCVTSSPLLLSMELAGGNSGTPTWHKMMDIVKNPCGPHLPLFRGTSCLTPLICVSGMRSGSTSTL